MHSAGKSWARRQGCDGGRLEADPAEEHQVRITLVDPKGDFCFAVRIAELHTSEAIRVPLKVCKCVVELYRADPFRLPKIVFGSLHGFPPDRKAALVGPQDRLPRYVQNQTVDSCGPKGQIWMSAASVRTGLCAEVRGRCLHLESTVGECIFDANSK